MWFPICKEEISRYNPLIEKVFTALQILLNKLGNLIGGQTEKHLNAICL